LSFVPNQLSAYLYPAYVFRFTHLTAPKRWALFEIPLFQRSLGNGLLMQQPASYTKIIPQLILVGKEEGRKAAVT
jgi:hypothetical protein